MATGNGRMKPNRNFHANVPTAGPRGRPTDYTPELADEICRRVADGETVKAICTEDGKPNRHTVREWLGKYPEFAANMERARESQADSLVDEALEAARSCWEKDTAAAAKVKVDTMFRLAGWRNPRSYGSKVQHEHSGPAGKPVEVNHTFDNDRFADLYLRRTGGNRAGAGTAAPDRN